MRTIKNALLATSLLLVATLASAAESLQIRDAWIREAPANAPALGGFATIENRSEVARTLVAARSGAFHRVQLHKTVMEGDVGKMIRVDAVKIPAKGEVKLQPGGLHIMLMAPRQPLKAGDKVEITLEFKDGLTLPVTFEVRRADGMKMEQPAGMDHTMHH